jgi:hypothetical protein
MRETSFKIPYPFQLYDGTSAVKRDEPKPASLFERVQALMHFGVADPLIVVELRGSDRIERAG